MYQMLQSSVPKTQPAQKEGPDLTGTPKQMKAGEAGDGVVQAITGDGHLGDRDDEHPERMYNKREYRWSHYSSQKEQGGNHVGEWARHVEEGAIHHIIPHDTLEAFAGQGITNNTVWQAEKVEEVVQNGRLSNKAKKKPDPKSKYAVKDNVKYEVKESVKYKSKY